MKLLKNDIYYKNSKGEVVYFTRPPYMMLADTDLFDYTWEDDARTFDDRKISLVISGATHKAYLYALDRLTNILDYDNEHNTYGRLYFKKWYINCKVTATAKPAGFILHQLPTVECTISVDPYDSAWHKDIEYNYRYSDASLFEGKKYPYGYPYGYMSILATNAQLDVKQSGKYDARIELTANATVNNPAIAISDYRFGASLTLATGTKLIIDTSTKKIYTESPTGAKTNALAKRISDDMLNKLELFTQTYNILWNGDFDVNITLIGERSEPLWI